MLDQTIHSDVSRLIYILRHNLDRDYVAYSDLEPFLLPHCKIAYKIYRKIVFMSATNAQIISSLSFSDDDTKFVSDLLALVRTELANELDY